MNKPIPCRESDGYAHPDDRVDGLGRLFVALRQLIRQKRIPYRVYGAEGSKNPRYLFSARRLDQWIREQEEANYRREVRTG